MKSADDAPTPGSAAPSPGTAAGSGPDESSAHVSPMVAITILHEVLSALAHDEPTEQVLSLITRKARELTDAGSSVIALLEGGRDEVSFAAAAGEGVRELIGTRAHAADTLVGGTARTGEPYLAYRRDGDAAEAPGARNGPAVTSAAVVPLFAGGVPVGALGALNKAGGRAFSGEDVMTLSTLATAASVALVGAERRDESLRQSRELSILYEAVRTISGHVSTQEVLRALVGQIAAHLASSAVAVFLLNDERTHFYVAEEEGLTTEQRERALPVDDPIGAGCLSTARALFLSFSVPEEDEFPTDVAAEAGRRFDSPFPELGARSGLAFAIRSGDVELGFVLVLSSQGSGAYTLSDANLLSALTAQAAIAIEGAYLFEDATRRAEEAAALYELSQTITSTLDLEDVLERIADSVLSLLSVDKFALFLLERSSDRLHLVVSRGLEEGASDRLRFGVGQGIPGWVLEFETPTGVRDVAADHRNNSAPIHGEGVTSLACMPLQVGSGTIGVLCAMSSRRRLFTVAEMELLYTIANQAAIAIENARIYADVRHKTLELRRYFHRVARALGSAQSPRTVPHLVASLSMEVMAGDRCALYVVRQAADGARSLEMLARSGFRAADEPDGGSALSAAGEPLGLPHLPVSEETAPGWIAKRGKPVIVEDVGEDTRFPAGFTRPARGRALSYVGAPLKSGREVIGVLEVYSRTRRRWRGDEVRLLLTFASQAAVALENARLVEERSAGECERALLHRLLGLATGGEKIDTVSVLRAISEEAGGTALAVGRGTDGEQWTVIGSSHGENGGLKDSIDPAKAVPGEGEVRLIWEPEEDSALRILPPGILDAAARLLNREPYVPVRASDKV